MYASYIVNNSWMNESMHQRRNGEHTIVLSLILPSPVTLPICPDHVTLFIL